MNGFSVRNHCWSLSASQTRRDSLAVPVRFFGPPEIAILDGLTLKTRKLKRLTGIERFDMEINSAITNGDRQAREPQDPSEAVIDKRILIQFWKDLDKDDRLIQEMVTLFLEEAPRQLIAAHQALANHDSKELGRIAHTLKGSSSYYGAKRLAIPCTALEDNCERGNLLGADSLLAQLENEFEAVREVLKSMVFQLSLMRESTWNQPPTEAIYNQPSAAIDADTESL
jgi:HPt (histidine-containing phosphotransfer) domain-containing protein